LREAACWLSDIGSHDHPEYRAEQSFLRVLRQPGVALDHHGRAFLAVTVAVRYEAEPTASFLDSARQLLDPVAMQRAEVLGHALRLAYMISAGTPDLLTGTSLLPEMSRLVLRMPQGGDVGDSMGRRLERLAQALLLDPSILARAANAA
jgi:exopolyphosphatase/guanosine-5'-triphosphate,3'-diphosphate pyrophosphatase